MQYDFHFNFNLCWMKREVQLQFLEKCCKGLGNPIHESIRAEGHLTNSQGKEARGKGRKVKSCTKPAVYFYLSHIQYPSNSKISWDCHSSLQVGLGLIHCCCSSTHHTAWCMGGILWILRIILAAKFLLPGTWHILTHLIITTSLCKTP